MIIKRKLFARKDYEGFSKSVRKSIKKQRDKLAKGLNDMRNINNISTDGYYIPKDRDQKHTQSLARAEKIKKKIMEEAKKLQSGKRIKNGAIISGAILLPSALGYGIYKFNKNKEK